MKTRTTSAWTALCGALALTLSGLAMAADHPRLEPGKAFVDSRGMTLYTYAEDEDNKSTCNADCAKNWPPLMADKGAADDGDWTVISRDDGSLQWAYMGSPLYTYKADKKPGDTSGDGKKDNAWQVARPVED